MSEVRNLGAEFEIKSRQPDDVERAERVADLCTLMGADFIQISDGRAHFGIPAEVYLAHVSVYDLDEAVSAVREHARIVARAIARLDPSEIGLLGLRKFSNHLRELVEAPASFRGLLDRPERPFEHLLAEDAQRAGAVDVLATEVASETDDHLLKRRDVGERLASVPEIHPEPLVPRRATPPP